MSGQSGRNSKLTVASEALPCKSPTKDRAETACSCRARPSDDRRCRRPRLTPLQLRGDIERHRVLPQAVGEDALVGAVGIHDEDLAVGLKRVVVKRGLVAKTVDAAVP